MAGPGDRVRSGAVALAATDPAALSPAAVADQVVELRRLIDGLEGTWSRLVAVLDGSGNAEGGTSAFLRSSCRLAPAAARTRVVLARRLAERPAVDTALAAGQISVDHARVVTHALEELAVADRTLAAEAEAPLLTAARQLDPTRLRREIAHARYALTPEASAAEDETRHQRRHLDVATTFDGMVAVSGLLSPDSGELLLTALTPLAGPAGPEDTRTAGQRRADALSDICHRRLDPRWASDRRGRTSAPNRPRPAGRARAPADHRRAHPLPARRHPDRHHRADRHPRLDPHLQPDHHTGPDGQRPCHRHLGPGDHGRRNTRRLGRATGPEARDLCAGPRGHRRDDVGSSSRA